MNHTCDPKGRSSVLATLRARAPTTSLQYSAVAMMVQTTTTSSSFSLMYQSCKPAPALPVVPPLAVLGSRAISLPAYARSTRCRCRNKPHTVVTSHFHV